MVVDSLGQEVAKQTYLPFGETWGSSVAGLPTDYTFTGQREAEEIGLMYYVARWYDTEIGHFVQADTIVPGAGNTLAWNRYAYVNYSPLGYTDPSGHRCENVDGSLECSHNYANIQNKSENEYDSFIGITNTLTFLFDAMEIVMSLAGTFVEYSITSLSVADPVSGDEPIALITSIQLYAKTIGVVENALGAAGFITEMAQGFHTGDNYFDFSTGHFHLGEDSTTELIFAVVGYAINEANADLVINGFSTAYDIVSVTDYYKGPVSIDYNNSGLSIIYNGKPITKIPNELDFSLPRSFWNHNPQQ